MSKRNSARLTLVLTLCAIAAAVIYFTILHDRMTDFEVFYKAGERFLRGENLYQPTDGHYQFKYLPGSALIFIPLALVPLAAAKLVWMFVVIASLAVIVFVSRKLCGEDKVNPGTVILTVIILARFYVREIDLGQTNAVMTALLLLTVYSIHDRQDKRAGFYLGLAMILKPYAAIFLPLLLIRRKLVSTAIAIAILSLGLILPALVYGWSGNIELHQSWRATAAASTPALLTNPDNVSLFAFSAKWFGTESPMLLIWLPLVVVVLILAALALATRRSIRQRNSHELSPHTAPDAMTIESAILLILIPLISPQGWEYVFLTATLGIMLLLSHRRLLPPVLRWPMYIALALVPLSIYDLLGRTLYHHFMDLCLLTPLFLCLITCLLWLRTRAYER